MKRNQLILVRLIHQFCFGYIYIHFPTCTSAIKKLKHKLVEKLNEGTADSLGISRAILIHGKYKSTVQVTVTANTLYINSCKSPKLHVK